MRLRILALVGAAMLALSGLLSPLAGRGAAAEDLPDMTIQWLSPELPPANADTGQYVYIADRITNIGTATMANDTSDLIFTDSPTGDQSTAKLWMPVSQYGGGASGIAPGASYDSYYTFQIPQKLNGADFPGGTYYFCGRTNTALVPESNYNNDVICSAVQIRFVLPDMTVSWVQAPPSSANTGDYVSMIDRITNIGNGTMANDTSDLIFTDSPTADQSTAHVWIPVGSSGSTGITPGVYYDTPWSFQIPTKLGDGSAFPGGTYYFCGRTNTAHNEEWNYDNDVLCSPIQITPVKPDLAVTSLIAPAAAYEGDQIYVHADIINQGTGPTLNQYPNGYSDDIEITDNPDPSKATFYQVLLGDTATTTPPGYKYALDGYPVLPSDTGLVPAGQTSKDYYICAYTDRANQVDELDETNNARCQPFTVMSKTSSGSSSGTSDLAVSKSGPETATVGGTLTYTVVVKNFGPDTATNVQAIDDLPAGLTLVSAGWSGGTCDSSALPQIRCSLGTIPLNGTVTITVTVTPTVAGPVTNTATATGDQSDPDPSNNSGSAGTQVQWPPADIQVSKTASTVVGGRISFTIDVTNNGLDTAHNVVAQDTLQSSLQWVSSTPDHQAQGGTCNAGSPIRCTLPTLAAGDTFEVVVIANVLQPGPISNQATGSSDNPDPDTSNNTSTASPGGPNLRITKAHDADFVVGQNGTYTITVLNPNSTAVSAPIAVTDTLPDGLTFVSADSSLFSCSASGQVITCPLNQDFPANSSATIMVTVRVTTTQLGSLTNTATVLWPGGTATASDPTGIDGPPQLTIKKTASAPTVVVGNTLIYTIDVTNTAGGPSRHTQVSDTLPAGVSFVSLSTTQGTCSNPNPIVCNFGTLLPGQKATVTITVQTVTVGPLKNTATVTGDGATQQQDTASSTVTYPPADIGVTKQASSTSVTVGSNLTYTLTARNFGPGTGHNVQIIDPLPPGLVLVSLTPDAGMTCNAPSPLPYANPPMIVCNVATLAVGATSTVRMVVYAVQVTQLSNTAGVSADNPDPNPANNTSATVTTDVTPNPGRMTGGGSVFLPSGDRVTHGFELHCDPSTGPNNLEVNWGSSNVFHLDTLDWALCTTDPNVQQAPPNASFNTYQGRGTGHLNGVAGATASWTFVDGGEPGTKDTVDLAIKDASGKAVLHVRGYLDKGDEQAHTS